MSAAPQELGSIYDDAAHYDRLTRWTAPGDLSLYLELLGHHGGPVLELACGTGRIAFPLARRGVEVVGVDRSAVMLARARQRAAVEGGTVELRCGDLRALELDRRFPLIILGYNAFNHLYELDDVRRCVATVQHHLRAEGRFVIDTFNPDPTKLRQGEVEQVFEAVEPHSGRMVRLFEQDRYDAATQINHVTLRFEVEGEAAARVDDLSMRVFFPRELDALLELCGLSIERKLGSYSGAPFTSSSSKQILICRSGSS